MKRVLAVALLCALTASALASPDGQAASADTPKKARKSSAAKPSPVTAEQLREIKSALDAQQQQIQTLQQQVQTRDQQIQQLQQRLDQNQAAAQDAQAKADTASSTASRLQSDVSDLKTNATNAAVTMQEEQKHVRAATESPAAIRFKGVTITPGGFIEAATVNRTRATSGDINTPFTGIPYNGNALSKLSEMNFTARQSRLSALIEGKLANAKVSAYYEADFLGAGTTSNNRQSNSYVYRQRQLFARADLANGWAISGGQMWSLATENVKGIVNRNERFPLQIDPQYIVGFTWQRAYALRVVKSFEDNKVSIGFSMEGPQTTVGGRGFSAYTNTSAIGSVTTFQDFFVNAPGAGGGLYNAFDSTGYTVNKTPDFVAKLAVDPPGWGHYEVFGILSDFRNRVYPCAVVGTNAGNTPPPGVPTVLACPVDGSTAPSVLGAFNDSRLAGGLGASVFAPPLFQKKLDLGLKVVAGDGIGRFGTAQLADVTARPDGTLAPIRTLHYLTSFVVHPNKKWDLYAYWGSEYDARASYVGYQSVKITNSPAIPGCGGAGQPACVGGAGPVPGIPAQTATSISITGIGGYGSPFANNTGCSTETAPAGTGAPGGGGTCAGDIRVISEATLGFWHKIYQGEKGRVQWGLQYSYIYKIGWGGDNNNPANPTISPKAINNMIFTSLRYYLP
ncbi:MAG: hypothetical protein LAN37_14370 [Acidobacteriia bacterium]|nr:hypothetical protein [Terriglobia bacterium]